MRTITRIRGKAAEAGRQTLTILAVLLAATSLAGAAGVIDSVKAPGDAALSADPESAFWKPIQGVVADRDNQGMPVANHMEVRSRWTAGNLYLLFVCPYTSLDLKPDPDIVDETNKLWNWNVAEAFIGDDFANINRYKEFEVSPHGEWVDLDIDREYPPAKTKGWEWNSGFTVKARIDGATKVWYAEMRIPMSSISRTPATAGLKLRINFYQVQGKKPDQIQIAWQPTRNKTFHIPAAFGIIKLQD